MRLRNTEHLELSTKMDSKCTHKKDSLHVFWMLRVIYKKKPNRRFFFQNQTETEPNPQFLSKPNRNRTELEKSIPHIPRIYRIHKIVKNLVAEDILLRSGLVHKFLLPVLCIASPVPWCWILSLHPSHSCIVSKQVKIASPF